ncbi:neural cell adhesion molecule L1.1-like isoform X2 [Carcharodon carcharias]|nr:neural cell adhesion molecule L1.1-like isoform X2 [Carcharodon carcharias]
MATYHFPKILCFILIFFCQTIIAKDSFTNVHCNNSVTGIHNRRTVLACEYESYRKEKCNSTWFDISVRSNVVEIPCTSDQKTNAQNRKRCLTGFKHASLIIEKTEILDIGKYQIFLDCGPEGYAVADVELLVKAPYTVPQLTKRDQGSEKGLSCTTLGYPLAKLHWQTENGNSVTANSSIIQTEDKLYNITTYISVTGEQCSTNHSCSVCIENACISASLECSTTEKVYGPPEQKIRASFGVTSSLGFIMFLTLMCSLTGGIKYFKHSYKHGPNQQLI